jgi:hypothetical protein
VTIAPDATIADVAIDLVSELGSLFRPEREEPLAVT